MNWVIVTGKGEAFVIAASSSSMAITRFQKHRPGVVVAQCFEATILQAPTV